MTTHVPVMIEVKRADGTQEFVRIGTAKQDGASFVLELSQMRVLAADVVVTDGVVEAPAVVERVPFASTPTPPPSPLATEELQYIASRARKTLADPSKARWHGQERDILRQAETELARLGVAKPPAT